ncbi:MAG: hypothetical protein ACREQY_19830, partial [Candidatus Binatia bacterium]
MSVARKQEPARGLRPRHESLGNILIRKQLLTAEQLDHAMEVQRSSGKRLGDILVELALVDSDEVTAAVAEQLDIPCLRNTDLIRPDHAALELLSSEQASKYRA